MGYILDISIWYKVMTWAISCFYFVFACGWFINYTTFSLCMDVEIRGVIYHMMTVQGAVMPIIT